MGHLLAANTISDYFQEGWGLSTAWALALAAFIHALILINFFAAAPLVYIWAERKISGRIQDRLGPTRVGGKFGWLQGLADGFKLIQKEDLVPKAADSMLFRMAPYIVCVASFCAFIFLPFSDGWVAVAADVGLFVLFAVLSLEVLGVILAGYSSGSKWALFGGIREAAQMVSYEIPLAISALVPVVAVGTLNLGEIGNAQSGWFWNWLMFHDPFCFFGFFCVLHCGDGELQTGTVRSGRSRKRTGSRLSYRIQRHTVVVLLYGRICQHVCGECGGCHPVSGRLAYRDRPAR